MAFTTSKLASSKAPKVRAIAQDTLFKKLFLNSSDFHLVSLFVSSSPSNRQRISKNKNVYYSRIFKYSSRAPSPTGRRGFRRNLVCSGGVVLDIQFKLKRLYGSSSCSQLHVKRSWIMRRVRRDVDVDLDLDLKLKRCVLCWCPASSASVAKTFSCFSATKFSKIATFRATAKVSKIATF